MGLPRIFGGTAETTLIGWRNEPTRQKEVLLSWGPPTGELSTTMVFTTGMGLKESMVFGGMISMVNKSSGQVEGVILVVLESVIMVMSVATCRVLLESHPGHGRMTTGSAKGLADPLTKVLQIELGIRESGEKGTQCSASSGGCNDTFGSCRFLGRLFTYCAIVAVECEWISDFVIAYDVFVCGTWEEQNAFGTSSMRGVLDGEKNPWSPLRTLGYL
ncbi:hypothetical protein NE237_022216 [Protea cynaroides]|uniref:Uncharacterized protein n=1 Tax=Protea cynaroides TaxID=273540 RepID=A0A9Q0HDZ4_9MAGN|nr:hypothetical protein NE237_022216 [Protea cynaroides]